MTSASNRETSPNDPSAVMTFMGGSPDRKKTLRQKSLGRRKAVDINSLVEFFDPIKSKKTLSKKTQSTRIKDKGSTQKHEFINKKVPADNST